MKNLLLVSLTIGASQVLAGSGMSGGTPPALKDLEQELMTATALDAGLFTAETGDIGLLSRKELRPEMQLVGWRAINESAPILDQVNGGTGVSLEGGSTGTGTPPSLQLSVDDISTLRDKLKRVEAVGTKGQNLSFDVLAGDSLNTVTLKDRRLSMRESIQ